MKTFKKVITWLIQFFYEAGKVAGYSEYGLFNFQEDQINEKN